MGATGSRRGLGETGRGEGEMDGESELRGEEKEDEEGKVSVRSFSPSPSRPPFPSTAIPFARFLHLDPQDSPYPHFQ